MSKVLSMNKWNPRMSGQGFSEFSEMLDEYQSGQLTSVEHVYKVVRHTEERCEILWLEYSGLSGEPDRCQTGRAAGKDDAESQSP